MISELNTAGNPLQLFSLRPVGRGTSNLHGLAIHQRPRNIVYLSSMPSEKRTPKRILLIDDHAIIRSALTMLLQQMYTDPVIEESVDGADLLEKLAIDNTYDLIIMDIQMPNSKALSLVHTIHADHPRIPVLIYSMTPEKMYAVRALRAGAKGFVSKESSMEEIRKAIDLVIKGRTYLSQVATDLLSEQAFKKPGPAFSALSPRELQIAELLLTGNTIGEICKTLQLKQSTIGTHKARIYQKLNVSNLLELKEIADNSYS